MKHTQIIVRDGAAHKALKVRGRGYTILCSPNVADNFDMSSGSISCPSCIELHSYTPRNYGSRVGRRMGKQRKWVEQERARLRLKKVLTKLIADEQ